VARRAPRHAPHLTTVRRDGERVTALELFFDLVFVLAITQCTALMATQPDWRGLARGLLVLGVLWWAWVGYAWLTSVVDPEEGSVRLAIFAAMAALLVVALCVPDAFGSQGFTLAVAYGVVRVAHIGLFWVASGDDPRLRRSVLVGLGGSTAIGVSLLTAASAADGGLQGALWALALLGDMAGPLFFGAEGWRLVPGHFAERHGLIVIIALGESIVAIGIGAEAGLTAGVIAAAVLGVALAAAMWWTYFDVPALIIARRLEDAEVGREQNELARDAFSFLHLPMVAGIVLVALGLKSTLAHVGDPLESETAVALVGGLALYLLAHVATRARVVRTLGLARLVAAMLLLALIPAVLQMPALAALAAVTVVVWALIGYEAVHFAELRNRVRHGTAPGAP
jgi:low temperature requirement protein LtrA